MERFLCIHGHFYHPPRENNSWNVAVDHVSLESIIHRRLEGAMAALLEEPENEQLLSGVLQLLESILALPVGINLWQAQNMYWDMLDTYVGVIRTGSEETAGRNFRREAVKKLGHLLYFNVEAALAAKGEA